MDKVDWIDKVDLTWPVNEVNLVKASGTGLPILDKVDWIDKVDLTWPVNEVNEVNLVKASGAPGRHHVLGIVSHF